CRPLHLGQPSQLMHRRGVIDIVRHLIMRTPDMRRHPKLAPRTQLDEDGYLYDPAIRQVLGEMGKGVPTEALEALTAVRLAAKRVHDEFQAWTESHGLSESRFSVLIAIFHSPGRRLPL